MSEYMIVTLVRLLREAEEINRDSTARPLQRFIAKRLGQIIAADMREHYPETVFPSNGKTAEELAVMACAQDNERGDSGPPAVCALREATAWVEAAP